MSGLFDRGVVLGLSRVINYSVLLFSPVLLVRILDVRSYGEYREFVLYATFAITTISFVIKGNLLFFIPRDTRNEQQHVSNTLGLLVLSSVIGIVIIYGLKPWLIANSSFDFVSLLMLYVFFYINPDVVESYWLAKKRSDNVLKYSSSLAVVRLAAIVVAAVIANDVVTIIYTMIVVEISKSILLLFWVVKSELFKPRISPDTIRQQVRYIWPLWVASILFYSNQELGKFFISINLGVVALALYTIATYPIPLLGTLRAAVTDLILPDMAERTLKKNKDTLDLWRKTNVLFCLVAFPVFVVLFYHTEYLITVVFTSEYLGAAPVFSIFLVMMLRQCFELSSPLKALNANSYLVIANLIGLCLNVGLLYFLTNRYGILGPAISLVTADMVMAIFVAAKIKQLYNLSASKLFDWKKILLITINSSIGIPVFMLCGHYIPLQSIAFVTGVALYILIYLIALRIFNIEEAMWVFRKISIRLRMRTAT